MTRYAAPWNTPKPKSAEAPAPVVEKPEVVEETIKDNSSSKKDNSSKK